MKKNDFLNLVVDHTTIFVEPRLYKVTYALFRVVFGVGPEDIIYEKRRKWPGEKEEKSMTFAARVGEFTPAKGLNQSILAIVEPTEPPKQSSHVRQILRSHASSTHCFHIALRTPDLFAFHKHASERGVNFVTPIMKDADEDLIQVFSGEWNMPGAIPSGFFFEFVQRNPGEALLRKLETSDRETYFRDKVFLGLYQEKENEYLSGKIKPFIDMELFEKIEKMLAPKNLWDIAEADIKAVESTMLDYAKGRLAAPR